jgi:hypothetical protein
MPSVSARENVRIKAHIAQRCFIPHAVGHERSQQLTVQWNRAAGPSGCLGFSDRKTLLEKVDLHPRQVADFRIAHPGIQGENDCRINYGRLSLARGVENSVFFLWC